MRNDHETMAFAKKTTTLVAYKLIFFRKENVMATIKEKWAAKKEKLINWIDDNPEKAYAIGVLTVAGVGLGTRIGLRAWKTHNLRIEQKLKDNYVYDHRSGMYVQLKRPLNNHDWRYFNSLRRDGLSTAEALERMGIIK